MAKKPDPNAPPRERPILRDVVLNLISTHFIVLLGTLIGFLLIVVGVFLLSDQFGILRLCSCIGFGIILASFGTVSEVKYRGWTITGAGAIALILYWILPNSGMTFVTIRGLFTSRDQIVVSDATPLLGALRGQQSLSYDFVIEGEPELPVLQFAIFAERNGQPIDGTIDIDVKKFVKPQLGKKLLWKFDFNKVSITDEDGKEIGNHMVARVAPNAPSTGGLFDFLSSAAYAQPPPTKPDFRGLGSDVLLERLEARKRIVAQGPDMLEATLKYAKAHVNDEREFLDAIYSLAMIQRNLAKPTETQALLKDDDLELLVAALDSPNKSTRFYAADFLSQLGDARTIEPLVQLASGDHGADAKHNAIVVLKDVLPRAERSRQEVVLKELDQLGPKLEPRTKSIVDELDATLKAAPQ